jgi:glycosyltransferase involved in cell wall biosynthesis
MIAVATRKAAERSGNTPVGAPPFDVRHLIVPCSDAHPSQANGVHSVVRQIAREQIAVGQRARIIFVSHVPTLAVAESDVPTKVVPAAGTAIRGHIVRLQRKVVQTLLADASPHTVFHIHGGREPLLVDLASCVHRSGIPYVITLHGRYSHVYDDAGRCQRRVTAIYLSVVERSMLVKARFVQALSPLEQRILRRIAPRARSEIIGNGAYSSRFDGAPLRPTVRSRSSLFPHFAYCGRYEIWHKGLDLLLKGFAEYKQNGGRGFLTMIGSGDHAELAELARTLGICNSLDLRGPSFGNDRDAVLRDCDFFVMASRFEGGPLAALEAALLGLPLLVTPGTGLGDVVASRGFGIPIADATSRSVCEAMHQAERLGPNEWSERSDAAYEFVVADGNWTAITAQLLALYRQSNGSGYPMQ